ncbi:C4b-binding protein alpha chain-like [Saccoglossus kowalevskii]|uniref:CUB and sushi domain-containing protein 1-like n=1 Tax=Saccoglossus kowalevskii TaxID=10224 RepID=A0ABM0MT15_SACKO|nr:PREDICTED: CUB and sushi domain-containing protein 1-like [Saccoglossus kowalevskii]
MCLLLVFTANCVLPAHPSNVDCYTTAIDGSCNDTTVVTSPGTVLATGDFIYVQCDNGSVSTNTGYSCFTIMGTSSIAPRLGDSACARLCLDPGNPSLGSRSPDPTVDGSYYETGDQVTFTCGVNTTTYGVDTFTCDDGNWTVGGNIQTALPPELCFLNCQKPDTPENGKEVDGASYVHAGSVAYECDGGKTMIGSSTLTCYNGTWDNSVPLCRSTIITKVVTTVNSGLPLIPTQESTLSLVVDATSSSLGAGATGSNLWVIKVFLSESNSGATRYLESDSNLSQEETDQDLTPGGAITFDFDYAVTPETCATYVCAELRQGSNTNFTLDGFDGDSTLVGCTTITCGCPTPGTLKKRVQIISGSAPYNDGDILTLACDQSNSTDGYSLFGGPELKCESGMWSENPESAVFCFENCPDPGVLTNGSVTCQYPSLCYAATTQITLSCDDGFQLVNGLDTFTCQLDFTDLSVRWNPEFNFSTSNPECQRICEDPGNPDNGELVGGSLPAIPGQTITYECGTLYTISSAAALQCQEDGSWDKEVPVCYGICEDPGTPDNGELVRHMYTSCKTGGNNNICVWYWIHDIICCCITVSRRWVMG